MMKRIIALLLALILTVGLLPTVALAAGETGADTAPADVIDGYYDDNNEWTKGELKQSAVPGVQTVSKTAKPTANPNEYEVTLKVVLKQTSETKTGAAATALVLDCSGSMDWCTECGQDWCRHKTDDTYNVTFDVHNSNSYYVIENGKYVRVSYCDGYHFLSSCDGGAGWYTSDRKRDHKSQNKLTPKISQTDSAATHVQFYTRTEGSFDTSRMTAAKNAAKNFLKTYSGFDASVIKDDGSLKDTAKDLSIKRYVAVIRFSNNIDNDTDSSSWWEGEDYKPAWYDVSTVVGYNKVLATINNASAGGGTNLDAGLTTASSLMDADLVKNLTSKNVIALTDGAPTYSKSYGDGGSTNQDICNETAKTAETLRVKSKVYTVCFAAESESLYDGGGTVGNFLKERIATQPAEGSNEKYAYNAKSAEDLIKVFKDITDTIVSGLNNGTVKDSLPTGITSTDFGNATQFELNDQKQFHKDVKTETVDGKEVTTYTYTKTYTVKIDPKTVKTEKVDGVDYAPLNGETTLTVGSGADAKEIPFPIPAGKVTFPQTTYTLNYDLNGGDANTLITQQTATTAEEKHTFTIHNVTPTREGYTFAGWTESQTPTAEDTRYQPNHRIELTKANNTKTLYAQWTPATNTGYTVEHYLQKLEGDGYTKQETEELTGTTGENVNAAPKSYTGFTCDEKVEGTIKSGTIAADGSLVLKLYYTRNSYTVTYTDGVDGAEVFADDEHNNVAYGSTIPAFKDGTLTRAGYNFNGWTSSVEGVTPSSAMPASNVTFTATWTEKNKATINYEVVGPAGCGSVNPANEWKYVDDLTAATGSTATANTGYRFVGWYAEEACNTPLSANAKYVPETPTEKWANATYYAKFEQIQVDVNLSPYVKKTLEVDGTLPTGFSETFKVDVTVDGQPQQQGTVTMTAAGTSNFNMPTVALTKGVHTIMVQEVVDGSTKNSNIEYDTNQKTFVLNIPTSGAAAPVQYGTTNSDGNFVAVEEPAFVTITNTYTEPKNAQVTNKEVVVTQPEGALKTAVDAFEFTSGVTVLYPTGDGAQNNTLEVNKGTTSVTLLYAISVNKGTEKDTMDFEDEGAEFVFAVGAEVTKNTATGKFDVTFNTGVSTAVIYVAKTHTPLNFVGGKCTVENVISEEIKATTTVTEKDPDKCTIDFSTLIFKVLTKTGDRSFNGAEFTASVDGWKVNQYDVMSMRVIKTHFVDLQPVTLKATFPANTTFDADGKAYRGFTAIRLPSRQADICS